MNAVPELGVVAGAGTPGGEFVTSPSLTIGANSGVILYEPRSVVAIVEPPDVAVSGL
jgi:hypothetical protein